MTRNELLAAFIDELNETHPWPSVLGYSLSPAVCLQAAMPDRFEDEFTDWVNYNYQG